MITSDCRSPDFSLVPDFYIFLSLLSVFPGMYVVSMCCKKKKKKSNEQINEELSLSEDPKMALFFFQ